MWGHKFLLFRILGIKISVDSSAFLLVLLIAWSLAEGFFPYHFPQLTSHQYWWMSLLGSMGLLGSILLHELSHCLVAKRYGLEIHEITLFIFGGVAQLESEPQSPKVEWQMSLIGPITSLILGGLLWGLYSIAIDQKWTTLLTGVLWYLTTLNGSLAIFNLVPAFPLDGGRILRALVWKRNGNYIEATRIAIRGGKWFGSGLIFLGVVFFFTGNFVTGMWWVLIGLFLKNAAHASLQEALTQEILRGETVDKFMTKNSIAVASTTSLRDFVDNYVFRSHHKVYPVISDNRLVGYLSLNALNAFPREAWQNHKVNEVMEPCSPQNTLPPTTPADKVLPLMAKTGNSRWLVAQEGKLVGIICLKDMVDILSLNLAFKQ